LSPVSCWNLWANGSANAGTEQETAALWVRQEYGFPGYRPGEHSLAARAWKRLMDEQRLLERLDPRLIAEGKGDQWRLWAAGDEKINVATLWDYFCRFPYLPMLTGPEALQGTIAWGVQRGLFAYARWPDGLAVRCAFISSFESVEEVDAQNHQIGKSAQGHAGHI
jgi:hypothetical protein